MRLKSTLCLTFCLMASQVHAGQPIFKSMAECAGIMRAAADIVQTPVRKAWMLEVSDIWWEASAKEAGQPVEALVEEAADTWRDKGMMVGFSQEYRDWTSYCGALAKHRKIKFPPRP